MASITSVFGNGTTYNATGLIIPKSNWTNFIASTNNSVKSILLGILIKASAVLNNTSESVFIEFKETRVEMEVINGTLTPIQYDIYLIKLIRIGTEDLNPNKY